MQLEEWLLEVFQTEHPHDSVVAYHIGIFENLEGAMIMYLTGSNNYSPKDYDWITNVDYEPNYNYISLLDSSFKQLDWDEILEVIEQQLRTFTKTEQFRNSFMGRAKALTVGFDEGNIYRVL